MKADGWTAPVPEPRYGKYGYADVTVKAIKGSRSHIRHFIVK